MPILRVRDEDGNIVEIPAIKGDKGEPGDSGVIVGSYVGDGNASSQVVTIPGKVDAVLILHQSVGVMEDSVGGLTLKGAWVTKDNPAKYNGVSLATLTQLTDTTQLSVNNWSFDNYDTGKMYTIYLNKTGVTYHYIAFTSKGVTP